MDIFCLETLYSATKTNSLNSMLPFVTLMLPSIIKGLTDQREKAKCVANKLFLWALPLLNFESSVSSPEGWNVVWKALRDQNRTLLCELFGSPSTGASLVKFSSSVFKNVKLRSYQKEGISWLVAMEHVGLNGLLCDDMGLGKTVQSLFALAISSFNGSNPYPSLVVCPASVVFHWRKEIEAHCAKSLIPVPLKSFEMGICEKHKNEKKAVYIMSYQLFRIHATTLRNIVPFWNYVVQKSYKT